jgi:hypothetical protein
MTRRILAAALPLLVCLAAAPTLASGGLVCTAEDQILKLAVGSPMGRNVSGRLYAFSGDLTLLPPDVAQAFRTMRFRPDDLAQVWAGDREIRIKVFREREGDGPEANILITIVAKAVSDDSDEESYRGTYEVRLYGPTPEGASEAPIQTFRGEVTCSME